MDEIIKLIIGAAVLVGGYFLGNWLAKVTKEEIQKGKRWFFILVLVGLAGGTYGFISGSDFLLFTMFFITIVSSRSLRRSLELKGQKGGKNKKEKAEEEQKSKSKKSKK